VLPPGGRGGELAFQGALVGLTGCAVLFLVLPTVVVIGSSLTASAFLTFPPKGLSLRWFEKLVTSREILAAAWTSALVAAAATGLSVLLGVAAAFPLARLRRRGVAFVGALALSPLMLPTVVYGLGLLLFLNAAGVGLSVTTLVLSHVAIIVPYLVRTTAAALQLLDPDLEPAAVSLGATRLRTFWHILLPHLRPAILTGSAFAFLASFDNLTVSLFVAGPRLETLPIRLYAMIEYDIDPVAGAVSAALALATFLLVVILERAVGLTRALQI
jgi:putative spermidine/putrescine transport system permease protein